MVGKERLLTADGLFQGKLIVYQEKNGYRFSLDAVLLAGLTRVRPEDRVVDLGTGSGVILLILAHREHGKLLVGLEVQPDLAALARKNVEVNGLSERVRVLEMDLRHAAEAFPAESFDLVLSNPPYRRVESGRISPHTQRALARHELTGSITDVFAAGKYLIPQGGRLAVIYPASRLNHLLVTAHQFGFCPKELTVIHSNISGSGRLVHVECRKGGGEELRISAPFFIYGEDGGYTDSMRRLYEG